MDKQNKKVVIDGVEVDIIEVVEHENIENKKYENKFFDFYKKEEKLDKTIQKIIEKSNKYAVDFKDNTDIFKKSTDALLDLKQVYKSQNDIIKNIKKEIDEISKKIKEKALKDSDGNIILELTKKELKELKKLKKQKTFELNNQIKDKLLLIDEISGYVPQMSKNLEILAREVSKYKAENKTFKIEDMENIAGLKSLAEMTKTLADNAEIVRAEMKKTVLKREDKHEQNLKKSKAIFEKTSDLKAVETEFITGLKVKKNSFEYTKNNFVSSGSFNFGYTLDIELLTKKEWFNSLDKTVKMVYIDNVFFTIAMYNIYRKRILKLEALTMEIPISFVAVAQPNLTKEAGLKNIEVSFEALETKIMMPKNASSAGLTKKNILNKIMAELEKQKTGFLQKKIEAETIKTYMNAVSSMSKNLPEFGFYYNKLGTPIIIEYLKNRYKKGWTYENLKTETNKEFKNLILYNFVLHPNSIISQSELNEKVKILFEKSPEYNQLKDEETEEIKLFQKKLKNNILVDLSKLKNEKDIYNYDLTDEEIEEFLQIKYDYHKKIDNLFYLLENKFKDEILYSLKIEPLKK